MQCPHCAQHFFSRPRRIDLGVCGEDEWAISLETCPNCVEAIIQMSRLRAVGERIYTMVYPRATTRAPLPKEIPSDIARDYEEAARLLPDSPKASAAMSRRCLRSVLHFFGFRDADLNKEINTLIASRQLPKQLAEWLDVYRTLARFDVVPEKGLRPLEMHIAEEGEPEILLDLLDGLFQYYFVLPAEMDKKRGELLSKLSLAWKNPT